MTPQQQHIHCLVRLPHLCRDRELVDVELVLDDDGEDTIPAHRVVLAASSGFFYALLCGSGRHMAQGLGVSPPAADTTPLHAGPILRLPLHEVQRDALELVLQAIYTGQLTVCWGFTLVVVCHGAWSCCCITSH